MDRLVSVPLAAWTRPLTLGRRIAASLITGFGVAAITHPFTVLLFFVTNGSVSENLSPISSFFLPTSLALFVLASLAAALGAPRRWYIAGAAGLITGFAAAFVGAAYGNVAAGAVWGPDVAAIVLATLGGTNLPFAVAAAVVFATAGCQLWTLTSRFLLSSRPIALVRQPSQRLADGEVTHIERVALDSDLADQQWDGYVEALAVAGFTTVEVETAEHLPDSVFIEDAIVVFGGTAVITSPGAESRRPETHAARDAARALGLKVREIALPGTLDGGDVLEVGDTVYVGRSGRTNSDGIRQLREILIPLGYSVVAVPVTKALHLKSVVTALPDGTVIGFAKLVEHAGLFERFLAMPEAGAAVVILDSSTVLMAASVPKSVALVESLGYRVVTVDVSEFEKLEGCVTCLSVRIR